MGKTEVAIRVANALHTDIVSADSRQIYKELSIGTAIPDPSQLESARHHLLQHRSVRDYYNASIFEMEALAVLEKIFQKNDAAVIAGGSGLYIRAICEGIDDIPPVDQGIRLKLKERLKSEGLESLRFELRKLDPLSYKTMDLKNPNRILKALEITMVTGRPYSSFHTSDKKTRNFRILKIGLKLDRDALYHRINLRVDEMMRKGLLEEARSCIHFRDLNALNTVGYKELFDHFDGKNGLEEAISLIKRNTRRYARRQITWFKRDPEFRWYEPDRILDILNYIREYAAAAG